MNNETETPAITSLDRNEWKIEHRGQDWNASRVNGNWSMVEFLGFDDEGALFNGEKLNHAETVQYMKKNDISLFCTVSRNLYRFKR